MFRLFIGPVLGGWLLLAAGTGADPAAAQDQAVPRQDLYGDPLPPGATARMGTIRFRVGGYFSVGPVFTPDGAAVITANEQHAVQFWEAKTGRLLRVIDTSPMYIRECAISPDGARLAVAGSWRPDDNRPTQGEIRILDAQSGEALRTFRRESREVNRPSLAFTPDGNLLVSFGSDAGILRIEEVATGVELLQQSFPRDNSGSLALSADGMLIAVDTGPNSRKHYLWKWQAGEEPQELKTIGEARGGGKLTFSPDGRLLAWADHGAEPIHIWNVASRALVKRLFPRDPNEYFATGIAFSPDGKQLFSSVMKDRSGSIQVWDAESWEHLRALPIETGRIAISTDGKLLATGSRVFDLDTGEEFGAIDEAHRGSITAIGTGPRGMVVTASDDASIRVWNAATGRQKLALKHDAWVRDIALSPDATKLVSSSLDDTVRLWDLADGKEIYRLPGHGRLGGQRAVAFTAEGQRLCSFGDDFYLRIYDIRNGKALMEHRIQPTGVKVPQDEDERDPFGLLHMDAVGFSPDAQRLVLCFGAKIFVFDAMTGQQLKELEHEGGHIVSLAISPSGEQMLVAAWGKPVEIKTADGRTTYTSEKNQLATLWDLRAGRVQRTIGVPGGSIGPGAFSPDGKQFAVAGGRPKSSIRIFRQTGEQESILPDVPHPVRRLAFSDDGQSIVAALSDTTAVVWPLEAFSRPNSQPH